MSSAATLLGVLIIFSHFFVLVDRIVSRITRAITLKDNSLKELQKSTNEDIQTIKNSYEERKRSASVKHPDGGKKLLSCKVLSDGPKVKIFWHNI